MNKILIAIIACLIFYVGCLNGKIETIGTYKKIAEDTAEREHKLAGEVSTLYENLKVKYSELQVKYWNLIDTLTVINDRKKLNEN